MATNLTPAVFVKQQVFGGTRLDEIKSALPKHVPYERFERNLINALLENPKLMECEASEVFAECAKLASLGLLLDRQLGEAYLITAWSGKEKRNKPQRRVGYRGLIKLMRQSGEIGLVYSHDVHAADEMVVELGTEKKLVHRPKAFGDRGALIGVYAVARFANGESDFEVMSVAECEAIRNRTESWKAYVAKQIASTPWATDFGEMAKKTVLRRLSKRLPMSPELAAALEGEDDLEPIEGIAATAAPASTGSMLDGFAGAQNTQTNVASGGQGGGASADGQASSGDLDEGQSGTGSGDLDEGQPNGAKQIAHPMMPEEIEADWSQGKRMSAWKWLETTLGGALATEVKQAVAISYAPKLAEIAGFNGHYKQAVGLLLQKAGCKIDIGSA